MYVSLSCALMLPREMAVTSSNYVLHFKVLLRHELGNTSLQKIGKGSVSLFL